MVNSAAFSTALINDDAGTDFVWASMADYWAATGQLAGSVDLTDVDDTGFRHLGYVASYGIPFDGADPQQGWW